MRNNIKIIPFVFLCLVCFGGCSGVSYSYVDENSTGNFATKVPVGSTTAGFEFAVVTNNALPLIESDFPTISVYYSSNVGAADKLKKLDVRLFVDEKEITADETDYSASHFNQTITISEAECCENLGKKLQIGKQKSDWDYPFGVHIIKKYKSLKMLPPQITVVMSATTDKGTVEATKKLNLKSYKDSSFIRVH